MPLEDAASVPMTPQCYGEMNTTKRRALHVSLVVASLVHAAVCFVLIGVGLSQPVSDAMWITGITVLIGPYAIVMLVATIAVCCFSIREMKPRAVATACLDAVVLLGSLAMITTGLVYEYPAIWSVGLVLFLAFTIVGAVIAAKSLRGWK